jgi:hypothetical protein
MGRNHKLAGLLLLAFLAWTGAGSAVAQEPRTGFRNYKPVIANPKDDELRKLQIERYNEGLEELKSLTELMLRGTKTPERYFDAGKRFVQSGLDVFDKPEDRIALLTDYVAFAKDNENVFQTQLQGGKVAAADTHLASYYRIDAEIQLLKAKRAAEKPKEK